MLVALVFVVVVVVAVVTIRAKKASIAPPGLLNNGFDFTSGPEAVNPATRAF